MKLALDRYRANMPSMPHPETWLTPLPAGLFCAPGDFFIDPLRPVERAVITHAHSDHARPGHTAVLASAPTLALMRARLGEGAGDDCHRQRIRRPAPERDSENGRHHNREDEHPEHQLGLAAHLADAGQGQLRQWPVHQVRRSLTHHGAFVR